MSRMFPFAHLNLPRNVRWLTSEPCNAVFSKSCTWVMQEGYTDSTQLATRPMHGRTSEGASFHSVCDRAMLDCSKQSTSEDSDGRGRRFFSMQSAHCQDWTHLCADFSTVAMLSQLSLQRTNGCQATKAFSAWKESGSGTRKPNSCSIRRHVGRTINWPENLRGMGAEAASKSKSHHLELRLRGSHVTSSSSRRAHVVGCRLPRPASAGLNSCRPLSDGDCE